MNQPHRRLRTGLASCALLVACVLPLAAAAPARAQYAFDDEIMPPRAVAWRLTERGFTGISRPRFDGRAYVVEAFGPNGARMRLFVDGQDGAILGRQRLDESPVAVARPAPGYGWTEDDAMPRRPMRQAERLLPPADIPMPESRGVPMRRPPPPDVNYARPDAAIGAPSRALADPNPQGVNPDRHGRAEPPRKLARVGSPGRIPDGKTLDKTLEGKAQPRTVPEAPKLRPVEAARPDTTPANPVATADQPKAASPPGVTPTPAAIQPPADGTVAKSPDSKSLESKSPESKPADIRTSDAKPVDSSWKTPPETKRNVRVIGGATLVPGTPDKEPAAP